MRAVLYVVILVLMLVGVACTSLAVMLSISLARTGDPRPRRIRSQRWSRVLATVAFVLALIAALGLVFVPTSYSTSTSMTEVSTATGSRQVIESTSYERVTLVDQEGSSVLFVLAIPVVIAALGAGIRGRCELPVRLTCGWFLIGGSILAMASIGLLFLPAAIATMVAGACTPRIRRDGRVAERDRAAFTT